jgi:hypothetical protein
VTSRQDPGIGGIREPKHEVAAGIHKAQRHELGDANSRRPIRVRGRHLWWIVGAVLVLAVAIFWLIEVMGTTAELAGLG